MAAEQMVNEVNLGAWILKCNPSIWDLEAFMADGGEDIERWSVQPNYRSELMAAGQLVFLWVTKSSGPSAPTSGIWGVGHITGPVEWVPDVDDDGYWLDERALAKVETFARCYIPLRNEPISREEVLAQPGLQGMELFRSPAMGNPLYVTPEEAVQLIALVGGVPEEPEPEAIEISLSDEGAGFGSPLNNVVVELQAMRYVMEHYQSRGWDVDDVSMAKVGWDLTCTRDGEERHVEVKGVSGSRPDVLLTRNERAMAEQDPTWLLAVVTAALHKPTLLEYPATQTIAAAEPYLYRAVFEAEFLLGQA